MRQQIPVFCLAREARLGYCEIRLMGGLCPLRLGVGVRIV